MSLSQLLPGSLAFFLSFHQIALLPPTYCGFRFSGTMVRRPADTSALSPNPSPFMKTTQGWGQWNNRFVPPSEIPSLDLWPTLKTDTLKKISDLVKCVLCVRVWEHVRVWYLMCDYSCLNSRVAKARGTQSHARCACSENSTRCPEREFPRHWGGTGAKRRLTWI